MFRCVCALEPVMCVWRGWGVCEREPVMCLGVCVHLSL